MQSPIIFLATADGSFEKTAVEAIFTSQHGARCAHDIREACHLLGEGTGDIALAIIDLDLGGHGLDLLHIIAGSDPAFPILVVADHTFSITQNPSIMTMATEHMVKPVKIEALFPVIKKLCLRAPEEASECLGAPYGRNAAVRACAGNPPA